MLHELCCTEISSHFENWIIKPWSCMCISLSLHNMIFDKWFMGHITPLAEAGTTITVPYLKLCHCNSFEDQVSPIFKWRSGKPDLQMKIFKWVAVAWHEWEGTGIITLEMATRGYINSRVLCYFEVDYIQYSFHSFSFVYISGWKIGARCISLFFSVLVREWHCHHPCKDAIMCENGARMDPFLAASGQFWSGSGILWHVCMDILIP